MTRTTAKQIWPWRLSIILRTINGDFTANPSEHIALFKVGFDLSLNVHPGTILLVAQWQYISSFVLYCKCLNLVKDQGYTTVKYKCSTINASKNMTTIRCMLHMDIQTIIRTRSNVSPFSWKNRHKTHKMNFCAFSTCNESFLFIQEPLNIQNLLHIWHCALL